MKKLIVVIASVIISLPALCQQLQTPSDFLGYELGSQFTYHHRVVDYYEHVAEVSPRVVLEQYGETYEGRPLLIAIASDPEHLENLGELKETNLVRCGLSAGTDHGTHVPFIWLSYNIHGNESVGMEASMKTLYAVASGTWKNSGSWLEDCVLILDPCQNPDGRELYTYRYRRSQGPAYNANPDAEEHHQSGLSARANHYSFDMNRDWTWQTQQETRQKISKYQEFMPQIHADFHEMGSSSTFFFPPGAEPWHEVITPWQHEFHELMGKGNASLFDPANRLYFTKESFDLFCPSFGDTWPLFNGAMGFTYEQGGGGFAGVGVKRSTDDTLSLTLRIDNHFKASMATIQVGWEQRERLLTEFIGFFQKGTKNPVGTYKSVVIPADNPQPRVASLFELLDKNLIEYRHAEGAGKKITGFNYRTRKEESYTLQKGDYLVSYYQPQSHFVKVLFEPDSYSKDSMTYDLSAWALPYVYDLKAYAVKERIREGKEVVFEQNVPDVPGDAYAYLAPWKSFRDVRFLADLLKSKVRVRYAGKKFTMDEKEYERGTLVITAGDNKPLNEGFHALIAPLAEKHNIPLHAVKTGMVKKGKDLGSNTMDVMYDPQIALITGSSVSDYGAGEMRYFFEQELDYPVTRINTDYLSSVNLSDYDVVILPSGNYSRQKEAINDFLKQGGKVIALEGAIRLFADEKSGTELSKALKKRKEERKKEEKDEELKTDDPENLKPYDKRRRERLSSRPASCIYRVWMDETHPYSFGIGNEWFAMKRSSSIYPYLQGSGVNVAAIKEGTPVSGFAGYKYQKKAANTLFLGSERVGRGEVVYVMDSPYYRAFWKSGRLLLGNILFH